MAGVFDTLHVSVSPRMALQCTPGDVAGSVRPGRERRPALALTADGSACEKYSVVKLIDGPTQTTYTPIL